MACINNGGTLGRSSSLRGERPNSFPRRLKGLLSGKAKGYAGLNEKGNKNKLAFNHFSEISRRSCFFCQQKLGFNLWKLEISSDICCLKTTFSISPASMHPNTSNPQRSQQRCFPLPGPGWSAGPRAVRFRLRRTFRLFTKIQLGTSGWSWGSLKFQCWNWFQKSVTYSDI